MRGPTPRALTFDASTTISILLCSGQEPQLLELLSARREYSGHVSASMSSELHEHRDNGAGAGIEHHSHEHQSHSHHHHVSAAVQHAAEVEQSAGSHRYGLRSHDGHSHGADGSCIIDGVSHTRADVDDANTAALNARQWGGDDPDGDARSEATSKVEYILPAAVSFPKPLVIRPVPWWRAVLRSPLIWALLLLLLAGSGGLWAAGGPENAARIARRTWNELLPPPPPGPTPVSVACAAPRSGGGCRAHACAHVLYAPPLPCPRSRRRRVGSMLGWRLPRRLSPRRRLCSGTRAPSSTHPSRLPRPRLTPLSRQPRTLRVRALRRTHARLL